MAHLDEVPCDQTIKAAQFLARLIAMFFAALLAELIARCALALESAALEDCELRVSLLLAQLASPSDRIRQE